MPLPIMVASFQTSGFYPQATPEAADDTVRCEATDPIFGRCVLHRHTYGRHKTTWPGFDGHW